MASGVYVNGKLIQVPGVYGFVDASSLAGKFLSTNNLAIVGNFPSFEHDAQYKFTSAQELAAWDPSDLTLARIASLAFGPASDDRIGGANSVTMLNVATNTQAYYDFKDGVGALTESLTLKAKRWGTKGNQVYCKIASNAADAKLLDFTFACAGLTETYSALGSGNLADLWVDTAVCTQMAGAGSTSHISFAPSVVLPAPTDGTLTWAWKRQNTAGNIQAVQVYGAEVLSQMAVTGSLTFSIDAATPPLCSVVATVVGKNALGVVTTKTATITPGQLANTQFQVGIPADTWSELTSIAVEIQGAPLGGPAKFYLHGTAFSLNLTEFSTFADVCTYINNYAARGWKASNIAPKAAAVPADQLDSQLTQNALSPAKVQPRADLWAIIQKLSTSGLVEPSRHDKALYAPYPWNQVAVSVEKQLLGGTENAVSVVTDFRDAFSQIETEDLQIVVAFSTNVLAAQELQTHCINAAVLGSERNGYAGAVANTSLADLQANWVNILKTRHVSIAAQEIQVASPSGALEWLGPEYQAVQQAAMQAGRSVGIPLTNKAPRVFGTRQSWKLRKDDNDVIAAGIYAYTQDNLGYKVLRSITTWVQDDNPAYVEVSTNESVNTSIRDVRTNLLIYVGNPATMAVSQLEGIVKGILAKQVQDGIIRAYRNVVVTQLADKYRIDYDVAPIFSANFFEVTAHVGDF